MLKLILSLLYKLCDRSRPKTETNIEVTVQQKISVVVININDKR